MQASRNQRKARRLAVTGAPFVVMAITASILFAAPAGAETPELTGTSAPAPEVPVSVETATTAPAEAVESAAVETAAAAPAEAEPTPMPSGAPEPVVVEEVQAATFTDTVAATAAQVGTPAGVDPDTSIDRIAEEAAVTVRTAERHVPLETGRSTLQDASGAQALPETTTAPVRRTLDLGLPAARENLGLPPAVEEILPAAGRPTQAAASSEAGLSASAGSSGSSTGPGPTAPVTDLPAPPDGGSSPGGVLTWEENSPTSRLIHWGAIDSIAPVSETSTHFQDLVAPLFEAPSGAEAGIRSLAGDPGERPPSDLPAAPSRSPGAVPGSGGSIFVPLAALLALLALVAPASFRRLGEVPAFRPPTPFVCALERPG